MDIPKFEFNDGMIKFAIEEDMEERDAFNSSIFKMIYEDLDDNKKYEIPFHVVDIHDIYEVMQKFIEFYHKNRCWNVATVCLENKCVNECNVIDDSERVFAKFFGK